MFIRTETGSVINSIHYRTFAVLANPSGRKAYYVGAILGEVRKGYEGMNEERIISFDSVIGAHAALDDLFQNMCEGENNWDAMKYSREQGQQSE